MNLLEANLEIVRATIKTNRPCRVNTKRREPSTLVILPPGRRENDKGQEDHAAANSCAKACRLATARLWSQMTIGLAMKIEEYVPVTTPMAKI